MKKINIFFLLPQFVLGGAGKSISTLCKNLNKNKFKIYIICLNKCYYADELKEYCDYIYEIKSKKTFFVNIVLKDSQLMHTSVDMNYIDVKNEILKMN